MRTQQEFQVEAIVAKYQNLASKIDEFKESMVSDSSLDSTDLIMLLLLHISNLRTGDSTSFDFSNISPCYNIEGLLNTSEEKYLVDNFAEFFNYAFDHSNSIRLTFDYIFNSNNEWNNLVPYILETKEGRIFIPYSDKGLEFVDLTNCEVTVGVGYQDVTIQALAQEISKKKHNIKGTLLQDIENGEFDVVIADLHHLNALFCLDEKEIETLFKECLRIAKDGGEILLCLSRIGILAESTSAIRNLLKRERILKKVIQLPSGNILLHIVKNPQDSFIMYDATSLSKKSDDEIVDVEAFQKEVEMAGLPERDDYPIIRRYTYDMFDSNVLLPKYYLNFPKVGLSIAELASTDHKNVCSGKCSPEDKVITINQMSSIFTKGVFKVADLPTVRQDLVGVFYHVHGPAVILAVSEQNIAIGYTIETLDFLVPDYLYVLLPTDNVDVGYLASKLLSEPVKRQVVDLVYGKGLNAKLIMNWSKYIRMDVLPLQEQQSFVQNVILNDYALKEKDSVKQEQSFKHAIRLRKHALVQNISAFDSLFHSLEYCLRDHKGVINENDQLSPVSSMTVGKAMEILHSELETINYQVEHLTESNDWGKCEQIEPQRFIETYEKSHACVDFKFKHQWLPFFLNTFTKDVFDEETGKLLSHNGEPLNSAWFPPKALQQIFDNIVANAREHGFKDKSRKDYVIQTSWVTDGLNMLIIISNNGEPLPKDVNTDLLLEYGYSTSLNVNGHSGIGGGEIAEIIRKFGGNINIVSSPEKDFTVTYILTIPLTCNY